MDLQNLMPQQAQPISRIPAGQLPTELAELAELTEETLCSAGLDGSSVLPASHILGYANGCSYDGDDES